MADFTISDREQYERKVALRALAAVENPALGTFLALAREVLGIPEGGFVTDKHADRHWPPPYEAIEAHPRFGELVTELSPVLVLGVAAPERSFGGVMQRAVLRIKDLGQLDNRFSFWAQYLLVFGLHDVGLIRSVENLYADALGDPQGRAFPVDVPQSAITKAVSDERLRLASPDEVERCIEALVRRKLTPPCLSWSELVWTPQAQAYLAATGKEWLPFVKQREAVRNAVKDHLPKDA